MNAVVLYLLLLRATALSFSGFASVPVIREDLVVTRGVLTDQELNSAIAISQASPGPLGLYVVVVGYFVAGDSRCTRWRARLGVAGYSRDPHRSRGAATSGLASPRRQCGDRHRVVRADGDDHCPTGARCSSERSVRRTRDRRLHCFGVGTCATCCGHHRVGLPGPATRIEERLPPQA